MNKLKLENGFSLIELSFSIAIFATSLIIISSFFINNIGNSTHSLRYRALDLCRTTLEEYKKKAPKATTKVEDYGEISNYNTQPFKRKIIVGGENLKQIQVTVFWQDGSQEKQVSLTTLNSTQSFKVKNETINSNQILRKLLAAKQELATYEQQEGEFPAWDKRSGDLKKVSAYYDKFNTHLTNPEQIAYRNPSFYNWWDKGYLLVYKQPVKDKFYCLTNKSGIYTIAAKKREAKHILGDLVANSDRDKFVFVSHATQFWREEDKNE